MESFGTVIQRARKASGMSQEELAPAVGIHWLTLLRIEKDRRRPDHDTALRLAAALHIPSATIEKFYRKSYVFAE